MLHNIGSDKASTRLFDRLIVLLNLVSLLCVPFIFDSLKVFAAKFAFDCDSR